MNRAAPRAVALETTLLVHGVPRERAVSLAADLAERVAAAGAHAAIVGVVAGVPTVGLDSAELTRLLDGRDVAKANTSNLGMLLHRGADAATTVSTTMELAACAGVRLFATGGIGGVHRGYGTRLDVSADLLALARFPVAVVASGVKSILDVESTREALETLGVPVLGYRTDRFPAFYLRESDAGVDATFDDDTDLAGFIAREIARTGRGVLVCNPVPEANAVTETEFSSWLAEAERRAAAAGATGRATTPAVLAALHDVSRGQTLESNIALARSNASLAGRLAAELPP